MSKVLQIGLTCKTDEQLEAFADRVSNYNKSKGFIVVEMEGRPVKERIVGQPDAEFEIRLEFKSQQYMKDFWTDPEYMKGREDAA